MSYDDCNAVGGMTAYNFEIDPKRLAFQSARYHFVSKMLEGYGRVLEVGCSDGWGARIVRQSVGSLDAVDLDAEAIRHARERSSQRWPISFEAADFMSADFEGYDAVYCLDLFEHIEREAAFLQKLSRAAPVAIIGTPSLQSQAFASEISRREHINCVTSEGLRERMRGYWKQAFVFGMNDNMLHVGHHSMRHYLLGLGCR